MTWKELFESDELLRKVKSKAERDVLDAATDYSTIQIFPTSDNIYRALNLTPFEEVKVVIVGQDPYHRYGQANGLAFSVNKGIKLPPSLRNIFAELQNDIGGELRTNGDLSDWAEQGVLLLNSSLTVFEGQAGSMRDIWEDFTTKLIQRIDELNRNVVFVLWGSDAQKKAQHIKNGFIVASPHPSPLSAYRGFFGSKPFSKINNYLMSFGKLPIKWN